MKTLFIKKIHKRQKLNSNPTASNWSSSAPPPPWVDLPRNVTANILRRLDAIDILGSAQRVCATWWRVCKEDPSFWRTVDMIEDSDDLLSSENLATMCRRAVDQSQGGLVDISLGDFVSDRLLRYISDRSSGLKRLRIASCGVTGKGLTEAVKKLPELEELHLFYAPSITAEDIEDIGIYCSMLKSFAFNNRWYRFPCMPGHENYALAVAGNMPKLRKLELSGHAFSVHELQAILDGCPWLESLDLQQTFVEGCLNGDLDTRCSGIKHLKRPSDSTWLDYVEERVDGVRDYQKYMYCCVTIGNNVKVAVELPIPRDQSKFVSDLFGMPRK